MGSDKPKRKRKKSVLTAVIVGLLLLLAFLFRNCLGLGLGTGTGESSAAPDAQPVLGIISSDAGVPPGGDAQTAPAVCIIRLDSKGMTIDGQPGEIADAVRVCREAGRVSLDATGGVRRGVYNELVRAE